MGKILEMKSGVVDFFISVGGVVSCFILFLKRKWSIYS